MAKNKPKIRFKGFEDNWIISTFGNQLSSMPYKNFIKTPEANGKYPVIQQGDNPIIGYSNGDPIEQFNDKVIFGDHTVSLYKPTTPFFVATDGLRIFSIKDISQSLLYSLFERYKPQSHGYTRHSSYLYESKIAYPFTKDERHKIGEYFKQLDELIEAREKKLDKLRQFKMAMLDKMFPKEGESVPAVRFRGFPEPWKLMPITECVTFDKGRGYSKGSLKPLGTPILLYGMLYTDYKTNIDIINQYAQKEEWAKISIGNEVVVPASGETAEDIARASAINLAGVILGGDLNIIYPNRKLSPAFLALEITYGNSHHKLVKKAQGVSVVHLHNSDISELDIMIPSIKEQQKIGEFFRSQDEEIYNLQEQINKLKTFKQACLSQMFV